MVDNERSLPSRFLALLHSLQELGLPTDGFAVFGSGPMAVTGLRDVNDLDIIVSKTLWERLSKEHDVELLSDGGQRIEIGDIEAFDSWAPPIAPIDDLIREADVIDDIRYVKLERVLEWKLARAEPKDAQDIELLRDHLQGSE